MERRGDSVTITDIAFSPRFQKDYKKLQPDVRRAVNDTFGLLMDNPQSKALRLHSLSGYPKPTIWKIDVNGVGRHAWQITFELIGTTAHLKRIGRHRTLDRSPR